MTSRTRPLASALFAAIVVAGLAACASTTAPGAIGIRRVQLLTVPSREVDAQAASAYSGMSMGASRRGILNTDAALTARVHDVAARLIAQAPAFRSDALGWAWEANVVTSADMNAMCAPGGKILVHSGLVTGLQLTDAELAAVLGHEIAHALREHGREKASQAQWSNAAVQAITLASGRYAQLGNDAGQLGAAVLVRLPFSRTMESEADLIGLELMARAGFDPRLASGLWRKLEAQSVQRSNGPEWLATHPADARRRDALDAASAALMPLYEAALARLSGDAIAGPSSASLAPVITLAPTAPVAAPAKPLPTGQDSFQVQKLAKAMACPGDPLGVLTDRGPGFETYAVTCDDGSTIAFRCSFGICRVLR